MCILDCYDSRKVVWEIAFCTKKIIMLSIFVYRYFVNMKVVIVKISKCMLNLITIHWHFCLEHGKIWLFYSTNTRPVTLMLTGIEPNNVFQELGHGTCRKPSAAFLDCQDFYCPTPFLSFHFKRGVFHPLHIIRNFYSVLIRHRQLNHFNSLGWIWYQDEVWSKSVGATSASILSFLSRFSCMRKSVAQFR